MKLTDTHRREFRLQGFTRIDDVLDTDLLARVDAAIHSLYSGEQSDGIMTSPRHDDLGELYGHPHLEAIARHILAVPEVVLNSSAILFKKPAPAGTPFAFEREHVDIMYGLDEWDADPLCMLCMLMVLVADLPVGRGNTYVRPGSQRQLAEWLAANGKEPVRAHPTNIDDLPDLDWADLVPVTGKAGQVFAFNTNLIHSGTPNLDSDTRRIMFINFCPKGKMHLCDGNFNWREKQRNWRGYIQSTLPPGRSQVVCEDDNA